VFDRGWSLLVRCLLSLVCRERVEDAFAELGLCGEVRDGAQQRVTAAFSIDGGERREVFRINLPATVTKGGKTTGYAECVYVGSDRLKRALICRRFELGRNAEAYVFGTKEGQPQKGFRRMWEELFTLAGLDWGRDKGIVWHTLRHEFTSRALEQADGDPIVAQKMSRHRDLRTTQHYLHARDKRLAATASRLGQG
jgi:hypothetical protein